MKNPLTALTVALLTGLSLPAAESGDGKLLFSDDFERNESDESKEMIGNGWTTNSRTRAKGRKQVDLRDGAIHIVKADVADHGVSVVHEAAFGERRRSRNQHRGHEGAIRPRRAHLHGEGAP
jgi:hypothetical protein